MVGLPTMGVVRRRLIVGWIVLGLTGVAFAFLVASIGRSVVSSGGPAPILEPTVAPGPGTGVLVKFFYGSGMRLRDGRFVSMTGDDVTPLRTVLATYPGTRIERLFQRSEAELEDDDAAAQASGDYSRPDLNLYYRLVLTPGTSPYAVVADLVRLPIVERAFRDRYVVY